MSLCRIAVILPSRGLIFSETVDELLRNLEGYDYDIFFSHGVQIPDCFEKPLQKALKGDYTHFWFVEDDMVLPDKTLQTMLLMDAPVVTMDYPVSKEGQGAVFISKEKRVVFSGTGCLLVKRAVFGKLNPPYFRSDIHWTAVNHGDFIRFTANQITNKNLVGYGLHDVNFGIKLWQADIPISVAGVVGQRKLIELGKAGSNEGAHKIEIWRDVKPHYFRKKLEANKPQPTGKLIEVQTINGGLMVHPDKAKKLIKAGLATKLPRQSVVIDYNEVDI